MARRLGTNRPKIERCVNKALQIGTLAALEDLPGRGKPATISAEARAWVVSLACQKPKDLGHAEELWTTRLLGSHVRQHCVAQGHPVTFVGVALVLLTVVGIACLVPARRAVRIDPIVALRS